MVHVKPLHLPIVEIVLIAQVVRQFLPTVILVLIVMDVLEPIKADLEVDLEVEIKVYLS